MLFKNWHLLMAALAVSPLIAAPVQAARPDLRQMSCAQAQELVRRSGAIVMTTGRYTYDRFVSQQRYCDRWETIVPMLSPTRDNPQCLVGYRCEEPLFRTFRD